MAREQRTKLTLKDLGEPSMVKALPNGQTKLLLGRYIGLANGFVERQSADKEQKFEGLKGHFRIIPMMPDGTPNPNMPELESGVAFMPDTFHNMVADTLRGALKSDDNASTRFAFQIYSIAAKNPAGYSWSFLPLVEKEGVNPLDEMIKSLPAPNATMKQLEAKAVVMEPAEARQSRR